MAQKTRQAKKDTFTHDPKRFGFSCWKFIADMEMASQMGLRNGVQKYKESSPTK